MSNNNDIVLGDGCTEKLIKAAEAFARTTYQGVFLFDCKKKRFLYVSDNSLFLLGHTAEDVLAGGIDFYFSHFSTKELSFLQELSEVSSMLLLDQPIEERLDYVFSCDYYLPSKNHKLLVHQKTTSLALDQDGRVSTTMSVLSFSSRKEPGPILAQRSRSAFYWEYSREGRRWKQHTRGKLSVEERHILLLSAQGYKMEEIADRICKSLDTVKFYKKRLFEKMEVDNITEALFYALNYRLI